MKQDKRRGLTRIALALAVWHLWRWLKTVPGSTAAKPIFSRGPFRGSIRKGEVLRQMPTV